MKSPFPGMDPYLERHWEDMHQSLAVYARDAIQPQLPDDLWARAEERVFVECDVERSRPIIPDVHVSRVYAPPGQESDLLKEGCMAVVEPVVFELHELLVTEGYNGSSLERLARMRRANWDRAKSERHEM